MLYLIKRNKNNKRATQLASHRHILEIRASRVTLSKERNMNSMSRYVVSITAILLAAFSQHAYAIDVRVELSPDPVVPGGTLRADITISNDTAFAVANVTMEAPVPVGVLDGTSLPESNITDGGQCNVGDAIRCAFN